MRKVKSISLWKVFTAFYMGVFSGILWNSGIKVQAFIVGFLIVIFVIDSFLIADIYYERKKYEDKDF